MGRLLLPLLVAVGAAARAQTLDYPALLARLSDVRWLYEPPAAGERGVQFSSYDRRSDRGPANPDDWYANDDRGKYLRVEQRSGQPEYVMVDAAGPGCLVRLWSANPSGMLHFDVDGERVWSVDFAALTSGRIAGIPEPLAGVRGRGANCHLPMPFQKHLKVTASKGDFYYHVNVLHLPAGTAVPSFHPDMIEQHAAAIAATVRALQPPALPAPDPQAARRVRVEVPAGHCVRLLTVRPQARRRPGVDADVGELLRFALLVVRCGAEETVRVPVLDFFNGGADWRPYAGGTLLGIDGNGTGYCRWPMPMPEGGTVELDSDAPAAKLVRDLDVSLEVTAEPATFAAPPLLFRASWHLRKNFASRPWHDFLVLDAGGCGRFVGCSLLVKNPHRAWWGEGDEKFTVDGESFPSTFGTGTEDYFGYAWCSTEVFSSAFHAQPQCDGPVNYGFTAVDRMQVLDAVPFQRSFRFDLEVWHWVPRLQLDYATVAYWYGTPGASSGLPPVPPAAERTLDRLPPPKMFVADHAIEGESLPVVSCSGGQHEVQDISFMMGAFSRDQQRWWRDGKPGDALVLKVPVATAGRYRVRAAFCRNDDYGIVQCVFGDRELGAPIDCYAAEIGSSGPLDLGEAQLPAGDVELRLQLVGRHDRAKPRFMVGLDYLLLERVP